MRSHVGTLPGFQATAAHHLAKLASTTSSVLSWQRAVHISEPGNSLSSFSVGRTVTCSYTACSAAARSPCSVISCTIANSACIGAFIQQQQHSTSDGRRFLQCRGSMCPGDVLHLAAPSARPLSTSCSSSKGGSSFDAVSNNGHSSSVGSPRPPAGSEITSAANPYIKHCVKLRQSAKYRQQQQRLLLVGSTLLTELSEDARHLEVLTLFLRPGASPPAGIRAQQVLTVSDAVMKKLSGLEEAAGVTVVAELVMPQFVNLLGHWQGTHHSSIKEQRQVSNSSQEAAVLDKPQQLRRLLVLEGVQDPGNLGTLLRCAAAFGWNAVWLLPGCCDPFNDKALRASRGAALHVPLAAGQLQELLAVVKQQNLLLLAAEPEPDHLGRGPQKPSGSGSEKDATASSAQGSSLSADGVCTDSDSDRVCLVLGTEGAGLSDTVLQHATPVAIPMHGHMESLNVAVAGSILMFALSEGMPQLMARLQQLRSNIAS